MRRVYEVDETVKTKIINVASVPQRSPFRYPGGKTWLVPYVRRWLQSQPRPVEEMIEPFAGGAIVGLTAAFEGLARKVTLIEMDPDVAAVWGTILSNRAEWLAKRIVEFELTQRSVAQVLNSQPRNMEERAFATIVRNRVQRGGILAPGAGWMKQGENGKGLASRWYPQTLHRRILQIAAIKDRLWLIEGDGLRYIQENADRKEVAFFIDPPYTVAGRRLYRYCDIDHEYLFSITKGLKGDFLITYDDTGEIRDLAKRFRLVVESIPMKNTHNREMRELLIGKNLGWLRRQNGSPLIFPEFFSQTLRGSQDVRR